MAKQIVCKKCGAQLKPGAKFCPACGAKAKKPHVVPGMIADRESLDEVSRIPGVRIEP